MEISQTSTISSTFTSQSPKRMARSNASAENSQGNDANTKKAEQAQLDQDQKVLTQLRSRDREVRAHEAAHIAAAGKYVASGPSYTFQQGPDGNTYAIGGEVQLDTSQEADASARLQKAETIHRAALAPAQPSAQDFSVAANATRNAAQARFDIAVERRNEAEVRRQERSTANDEAGEKQGVDASEIEQRPESSEAVLGNVSVSETQSTNTQSANNKLAALYGQQSGSLGADVSRFA